MHTKVPGCGTADRVLLLTEKASVICAETRAGGERGKLLSVPWPKYSDVAFIYYFLSRLRALSGVFFTHVCQAANALSF